MLCFSSKTKMQIQVTKNVHFTKLVKVHNRLREFNFRMLPGTSNSEFHVDVPDDRGNRLMFRMHRQENQWKIVDGQLPQWIRESEPQLNEHISEEIR